MNQVNLIGRLTKDPNVRYANETSTAIARFSIAIDRGKDRSGNPLGADFPNIICFGRTAENMERYCKKGMLVGIVGRIQTGSYEDREGKRVYTTDVIAERVEFLSRSTEETPDRTAAENRNVKPGPDDFADDDLRVFRKMTDDDIPFGG